MSESHNKKSSPKSRQYKHDAIESSAVTCLSGGEFINEEEAAGFFSFLLKKSLGQFVYGWLLLSVGLSPKRLEKLTLTKDDKITTDQSVHLNLSTGTLSYTIMNNGNYGSKKGKDQDRDYILLPSFIIKILSKATRENPFLTIHKAFDKSAREYDQQNSGNCPSAATLARSFKTMVQPHMEDNLLGNTLSGKIKYGFTASSYYYGTNNTEINNQWQTAHARLVSTIAEQENATSKLKKELSNCDFNGALLDIPIGSRKVINKLSLVTVTKAIVKSTQNAHSCISQSLGINQVKAFSYFFNLQSSHLFYMQRYAYSLRTVGDRTIIYTNTMHGISVIEDKDSKDYIESRIIPCIPIEQEQQAINQRDLAGLLEMASQEGLDIQCEPNILARGFAICTKVRRCGKTGNTKLILLRFKQKHLKKILKKEGIDNPGADNANRHYLATHLRGQIPQPLLDQLMSHNRAGFDLFSPFSSASIKYDDFDLLVKKIMGLFPFRLIDLSLPNDPCRLIQCNTTSIDTLNARLKKAGSTDPDNSNENETIKIPRPAILASYRHLIHHLPAVVSFNDWLWDYGFAEHDEHSFSAIAVALSCCLHQGCGNNYLIEMLSRAQWGDLKWPRRHLSAKDVTILKIPLDRGSDDSPFTTLALNDNAASLLLGLERSIKPNPTEWIFAPQENDATKRKSAVMSQWRKQWASAKKSFKIFSPKIILPNLDIALNIGKFHALYNVGIAPYIISLHSHWPPTIAHSGRHQDPLFALDFSDSTHREERINNFNKTFRSRGFSQRYISSLTHGDNFKKSANKLLRNLESGLKNIAKETSRRKSGASLKNKTATTRVHSLIDDLLIDADALNPEGYSALHLALEWIRAHYRFDKYTKNIEARSVATYCSELFNNRLLSLDGAEDLTAIDPDDLMSKIVPWTKDSSHKTTTSNELNARFRDLLSFGEAEGFLPHLDLPYHSGKAFLGTRRSDLINPFELDDVIRCLMKSAAREDQEQGALIILAHYAGLRDSEIRMLTLNDVLSLLKKCWIYIRSGKSKRARRSIPLHLFAHSDLIKYLYTFWQRRKEEMAKISRMNLDEIFFLGPEDDSRGYERPEISEPVIALLKYHFGPDADIHVLRHGFGSWSVLRLTALYHPDIIENLTIGTHWMFHLSSLKRLRQFYSLGTGSLSRFETNSLIRLGRVIGHAGARTLFGSYVQTFSVIQYQMISRVNACFAHKHIDFKMASHLFRGLRSSDQYAELKKLEEQSAAGILSYLTRPKRAARRDSMD